MSSAAGPVRADDSFGQLVRLTFLVRLAALVLAVAGLVGSRLTPQVFVAVLALGATSFVGLSQPRLLELVMRHPSLAMADLAVVIAVFVGLGVDSPLVLGALSTAFLLGVLFPLRVSALLGVTLLVGYFGAALRSLKPEEQATFLLVLGMPTVLFCLVGIGQAVRRIHTAQRVAERQLAQVMQAQAAESERSRLAREVHDSLAKSLQGLAFGAAALPTWVERDGPRAQHEARELARGANQAVQEARVLLTRMRSDEVSKPFDEVLEGVLEAWSLQHDRPIETDLQPVTGLEAEARYQFIAAAREALENIQRHAPRADVLVTLRGEQGKVQLLIADAGPGFDPQIAERREAEGHFGLRGLRERMAEAGGGMQLRSEVGQGTTVLLWAPTAVDPSLQDHR
jgi:signal transduction histidine kinase